MLKKPGRYQALWIIHQTKTPFYFFVILRFVAKIVHNLLRPCLKKNKHKTFYVVLVQKVLSLVVVDMTYANNTKTWPGIFWLLKNIFRSRNCRRERSRDAFQSLEWAADGSIVRLLRKKNGPAFEKKSRQALFFETRLWICCSVCGGKVLSNLICFSTWRNRKQKQI